MNILKAYFNNQLVKAGFPDDLDIHYSLSYCQGDGVAFYGNLYADDWLNLFKVIYPNQKRKFNMFTKLVEHICEWNSDCMTIRANGFGIHYSHWNTMWLDGFEDADDLRFFWDNTLREYWYFPKSKVNTYKLLWEQFVIDLKEHIKDTSKQLAYDGYKIIDATPSGEQTVYQFATQNYCVELTASYSDFYLQGYWLDVLGDATELEEHIEAIMNGEVNFADLTAKVIDLHTDNVIGEDSLICVSYDAEDKKILTHRQDLVGWAIQNARENIQRYRQIHA